MTNLAQVDFARKGREARTRALLDDLVTENYRGTGTWSPLALAVWYAKSPDKTDQYLLLLFGGMPIDGIAPTNIALHWKSGVQAPPFVHIEAMNVSWYSKLSVVQPDRLKTYDLSNEVLYFDKNLLTPEIMDRFAIRVEPPGMIKGWYVPESEYVKSNGIQHLLSRHSHTKWSLGIVKTAEASDFKNCRGVLHVEVGQKWRPFSAEGIQSYGFYNDLHSGRDVYFLLEGGSLYQALKFEVRTAPEYADILLETTPDNRYPEVYLRAVHPSAKPAT